MGWTQGYVDWKPTAARRHSRTRRPGLCSAMPELDRPRLRRLANVWHRQARQHMLGHA